MGSELCLKYQMVFLMTSSATSSPTLAMIFFGRHTRRFAAARKSSLAAVECSKHGDGTLEALSLAGRRHVQVAAHYR